MDPIIVGIDIGASKTHIRAMRGDEITFETVLVSSSWRCSDWSKDAQALVTLLQQQIGADRIGALAVGAHGCDSHDECSALEKRLCSILDMPLSVRNDAELMPAALGHDKGIGLISGTGSIAVTRNERNHLVVSGGMGWVLGEEGGAAGLVREAARRLTHQYARTGSADPQLAAKLEASLDVPMTRFGGTLSRAGSGAAVGQHARAVFAAAEAGSALAQEVIEVGAASLVDLILWLRARLPADLPGRDIVVAGGGMITAQPVFYTAFERISRAQLGPAVSCTLYQGPPVAGACHLAKILAETTRSRKI